MRLLLSVHACALLALTIGPQTAHADRVDKRVRDQNLFNIISPQRICGRTVRNSGTHSMILGVAA